MHILQIIQVLKIQTQYIIIKYNFEIEYWMIFIFYIIIYKKFL